MFNRNDNENKCIKKNQLFYRWNYCQSHAVLKNLFIPQRLIWEFINTVISITEIDVLKTVISFVPWWSCSEPFIPFHSDMLMLATSSVCDHFDQEVALLPRDVIVCITQHQEPHRRGRSEGGSDASVCVTELRWSSSVGEMSVRSWGLAGEGCGVQTPAHSLVSNPAH